MNEIRHRFGGKSPLIEYCMSDLRETERTYSTIVDCILDEDNQVPAVLEEQFRAAAQTLQQLADRIKAARMKTLKKA